MNVNVDTNYKPFLFLSICILLLLSYYSNHFLLTEEVFYNFYAEQLSNHQIEELLNKQNEWSWLVYILIPISYILKILLVTSCIYTGLFFYRDYDWKFNILFSFVVKADLIFLLPSIIKIVWFSFCTNYTLIDFQAFTPLALSNLFNLTTVEKWLLYPLQVINVFEIFFWFLLAIQIKKYIESSLNISFQIVLFSYGTGFLLWVVFVTFLSLNAT